MREICNDYAVGDLVEFHIGHTSKGSLGVVVEIRDYPKHNHVIVHWIDNNSTSNPDLDRIKKVYPNND
jgi:hypothetical protein